METYISASSPLFQYKPCKSCDTLKGFQTASEYLKEAGDGKDSGMITRSGNTNISLNCTGTGILFDITYNKPESTIFGQPIVKINGSLPSTSFNHSTDSTSIVNLPLGHHRFELSFSSNSSTASKQNSEDNWVRIDGASCISGYELDKNSKNQTIDDTNWRDWQVILSPGWNMLEKGVSNYIDETEYEEEKATSSNDYNGSISWTEQANTSTQLHFHGSSVSVYGIGGQEAGSYEVLLDNITQGVFDASGGPRVYNSVLYHTLNLADTDHTITLKNIEQGKRLSFDRLVTFSGLTLSHTRVIVPISNSSTTFTTQSKSYVQVSSFYSTSSSSASASSAIDKTSTTGLSGGAIAGIVVAACAVILAFLLIWIFAFLRKRKDQRENEEIDSRELENEREKPPINFLRFSSRGSSPTCSSTAHPFRPIPEPEHPSTRTSQHPMNAPGKPRTSKLFNFASPTPSLKSFIQNHIDPSNSFFAEKESNQNSFLKLNGSKLKTNHQKRSVENHQNEVFGGPSNKAVTDLHPNDHHPVQSHNDLSQDYLPSLASGAIEVIPTKSSYNHVDFTVKEHNQHEGDLYSQPIRTDSRASSTTKRQTISPLVAALTGKTASPLTQLSRSASQKGSGALAKITNRNKARENPSSLNNTRQNDRNTDSIEYQQSERPNSNFTLKTAKTDWEDDTKSDIGILSMYANLPPPINGNSRDTTFSENSHYQDPADESSGVGVALGSPTLNPHNQQQSQHPQQQQQKHLRPQGQIDDLELLPPTRRFLGASGRPGSDVSNKSAGSIGSGYRYM
ncbi:uncharacterized protein L201_007234 [Kwoniella dendrophila CBS 6074]|uniref:Uncharacterized protein n=1 Tax=Kwoniella dendrophila CBS 6074 TaxID=1295534 RepID=A0AAX4K634_9TREE